MTGARAEMLVNVPTPTSTADSALPDGGAAVARRAARTAFERARQATHMGKFPTALVLLETSLREEPDHPEYLGLYGYCLARQRRDLDKALQSCRHAVEARSYDALLHAQLGFVYQTSGLSRRARECYELALRWDPEQELALDGLAALDHPEPERWWCSFLRSLRG